MKNVFSFRKMIVFAVLIVGTSGCSVGVVGSGETPPAPPVNPLEDKVTGPGLEGLWVSSCNPNYSTNLYEITSMKMNGKSVQRKTTTFSDGACTNINHVSQWTGSFHYVAKYGQDIFELEYLINLGNGVTQYTGENIRLNQNVLWISKYNVGEYGIPTLALTKTNNEN